ncbi:unnamed protein product [Eruca vesicaria subsp. sativa]|uniref:Uncharacterized protein n=1 Tax=Eruca vesicaria subsp. sativa TaxID=29727 RepID=A0ABC8KH76_ERUVS|nr:unnamed protein product [Eruca vesicaria subsp. sativa]
MAIEKQKYSRSDDEFCSLVFQTFISSTDAIITIDKEEDETLESKKKKSNNLVSNSLVPSTCTVIIIDDDDEEETLDSKKNKKRKNLNSNSLVPSTNSVINDEKDTLEPKQKKPRLGCWWDEVDAFDELSCVVKGLPKSKNDAASVVDSRFSLTNLPETKPKEGYSDSVTGDNKGIQDRSGYSHMSLEDSGISVEDPSLGGYVSDIISPIDSCFSSSSSRLQETEANTNKNDERSLSSSNHHGNNFIRFREDEIVGESSTNISNKGHRHLSLEELGVSVEDLKSMPWEAFDPTWEIRSETMDPWLGGYIQDMFSAH